MVKTAGMFVLAGLFFVPAMAGEVQVQRVFGSEAPGPYKHPASITELAGGDLYIAYYGGEGEYARDTAVYGSRLAKGSQQWTAPVVIADTPFRSEGNAVVWQAPDGLVWLFYVVRFGDTWSSSRINFKISRDGAQTWSDPALLTLEEGTMVRGRPLALADGDYLLPVYHETGHDIEKVGPDTSSYFLRFHPADQTWTESQRIESRLGNLQPAAAELSPGHLVAYCRRGGGYDPIPDGFIVRSESHDGGRTWSKGEDTKFPNPNAAVDFLRLASGNLLLVYNDSMTDRTPLTVALSTDGDRSYPHRRNIAVGPYDYAYPYVIQAADGRILLVYTSHERTVINLATFDESALLQK
ncbi:MAG: exo-alpha-sialidase [Pirellulales bacterium]|nr:exo-alpha-sialidase [Pirellulales bacterium]